MGQVFDGRSNTIAPILGAKFWREGVILKGLKVLGDFDTRNGKCVSFHVGKPIMITADQVNPPRDADFATEVVAVGNMKGFEMAVTASGAGKLQPGDVVDIECLGSKDVGQASDMVTFHIHVLRP